MKVRDWSKLPTIGGDVQDAHQHGETKWVKPEIFFDELPAILGDVKPFPGEETRYAQLRYLAALAKTDKAMRDVMIDEAKKTDTEMVDPLLQLRNFGLPRPANWGTIDNGAEFGIDYFTRTAVARSNILVNKPKETKYFYQDLDETGKRLSGSNHYTLTFGKELMPVNGFWSLTIYNEYHFFPTNELNRYSIGTKSPNGEFLSGSNTYKLHLPKDVPAAIFWSVTAYDATEAKYL